MALKGRLALDKCAEFLEQLRSSRSRTVTVGLLYCAPHATANDTEHFAEVRAAGWPASSKQASRGGFEGLDMNADECTPWPKTQHFTERYLSRQNLAPSRPPEQEAEFDISSGSSQSRATCRILSHHCGGAVPYSCIEVSKACPSGCTRQLACQQKVPSDLDIKQVLSSPHDQSPEQSTHALMQWRKQYEQRQRVGVVELGSQDKETYLIPDSLLARRLLRTARLAAQLERAPVQHIPTRLPEDSMLMAVVHRKVRIMACQAPGFCK